MLKSNSLNTSRFDWVLIVSVLFLITVGLSAIYSVDLSSGSTGLILFKKQSIALVLGLILLFLASFSQHTFFRSTAKWWYLVAIIFLFLVLFFGQKIRGTTGWFVFGGFSFQPVEFAKIGLILMLAYKIGRASCRERV